MIAISTTPLTTKWPIFVQTLRNKLKWNFDKMLPFFFSKMNSNLFCIHPWSFGLDRNILNFLKRFYKNHMSCLMLPTDISQLCLMGYCIACIVFAEVLKRACDCGITCIVFNVGCKGFILKYILKCSSTFTSRYFDTFILALPHFLGQRKWYRICFCSISFAIKIQRAKYQL